MENPFEIIIEKLTAIERRLDAIEANIKEPLATNDQRKILSSREISEYLGLAMSTIYGKVYRREIPFMKGGSKLHFDIDEINEWLRNGSNDREPIVELKKGEQENEIYLQI